MGKKLIKYIFLAIFLVTVLVIQLVTPGCVDNNTKIESNQEDYAYKIDKIVGVIEGKGIIDQDFDLNIKENNDPSEIVAGNFLILYHPTQKEGRMEMLLILEMLYPDIEFTGTIEASLLSSDRSITSLGTFELNRFKQGDTFRQTVEYDEGVKILNMKITGEFK